MKKTTAVTLLLIICVVFSFSSLAAGDPWDCPNPSCGKTGNTGNFCENCGFAAPTPSPAPTPSVWECSNGHKGNTGNFCPVCGQPRITDEKDQDSFAYIMFSDADWEVQYWGKDTDGVTAKNASITGVGDYSVSLTFDRGTQGIAFTAISIQNGETLFPDYYLRINAIRINGKEIPFSKGFTYSDDGIEMRMDIYNEWISDMPSDARSFDGSLAGASSIIVKKDSFASIYFYEIDFSLLKEPVSSGSQADAAALFQLGIQYEAGDGVQQDYRKAFDYYQKAADLGNSDAMLSIGVLYANGTGVVKNLKEAAKWFKAAAELGNVYAQYYLGRMYRFGEGIDQDQKEAAKWFKAAAEQGSCSAQFSLGYMYQTGQGVPKNPAEAIRWYTAAAEQGDVYSQYNLARLYDDGKDIPRDRQKALFWYRKAAEQGFQDAIDAVKRLE